MRSHANQFVARPCESFDLGFSLRQLDDVCHVVRDSACDKHAHTSTHVYSVCVFRVRIPRCGKMIVSRIISDNAVRLIGGAICVTSELFIRRYRRYRDIRADPAGSARSTDGTIIALAPHVGCDFSLIPKPSIARGSGATYATRVIVISMGIARRRKCRPCTSNSYSPRSRVRVFGFVILLACSLLRARIFPRD